MAPIEIAVIVGSLRRDSFNRKLANAITKLAPTDFLFRQIEIGDLPLYNQDDDANPAASVTRLKAEIAASQALIFVTPEYNRSIPGVLKNAIDHASRPYGQSAWAGKPAGVLGASAGPMWVRRWRNSICATFWRVWMSRSWACLRCLSMSGTGCSTRLAISATAAGKSCSAGWIDTSAG